MIEPLWLQEKKRPVRTVPVEAKPQHFIVRGRNFLYDPNDMRLFHCDEEAAQATLNSERPFLTGKPQFSLPAIQPRMAVLVLTHRCNLRCSYCFQDHERRNLSTNEPEVMSLDTARQTMMLLPAGVSFRLGFFGGEPLLYPKRLREIVQEAVLIARHRGVEPHFSLTTNATMLDGELAHFLNLFNFSLIVSLDGPEELHDAARPLAGGKGSYAAAVAGLELLAEYPALAARTTLRATFSGEDARLVERLKHLNNLADEYGFGNVSVEPADLTEGCARGKSASIGMNENLESEYHNAALWYAERLRSGRRPRFHHFTVRLNRLLKRTPQPSECGAGCGYLTVNPQGEIFACHREGKSIIGNVHTGIDTEAQAPWRDNRYYARKKCPECWLRNVCGGGCRWVSLENMDDLHNPDNFSCELTRVCTESAAWILSELTDAERRRVGER